MLGSRRTGVRNDEKSEESGLKFFDPLRSPDEEMMRMETELVRRAAVLQSNIPINHDVMLHKNLNLGPDPIEKRQPRHRFKSSPSSVGSKETSKGKDTGTGNLPNIDSFITKNLDGLEQIRNRNIGSLANSFNGSTTVSRTQQEKNTNFKISESIKQELMDRQKRVADETAKIKEESHYLTMKHRASPKKPPPPPPQKSRKSRLRSTESCSTLCSSDSIYATVDKSKKRSVSRNSCENFYQSVDVTSVSNLQFSR